MKKKIQEKFTMEDLRVSPGLAEVKVVYKSKSENTTRISTSQQAFDVLFPLFDPDIFDYQEQSFILLLNNAHRLLGWAQLGTGGTTSTIMDPKILFSLALLTNCHGIILGHNHPSGLLTPSDSDINITVNIGKAGHLFSIQLLDHLIINSVGQYFSFADEGKL